MMLALSDVEASFTDTTLESPFNESEYVPSLMVFLYCSASWFR